MSDESRRMRARMRWAVASVSMGLTLGMGATLRGETPAPAAADAKAPATRPAVKPKDLSENVKKGLAYLAERQHKDGSWGQGEESSHMGQGMDKFRDMPNVADTCMATLALLRSGSTAREGPYKDNVLRAVHFVCASVEESGDKDLSVTKTQGTRTQQKLGQNIDTFLAARLLAEVKGELPSEKDAARVEAALAKVLKKIEVNQKDDGRFAQAGWAPVLAQGEAAKAVNVAAAKGAPVPEATRARLEQVAAADFAVTSGGGRAGAGAGARASAVAATPAADVDAAAGETVALSRAAGASSVTRAGIAASAGGDAGVELYARGSQIAAAQASANANALRRPELEERLARLRVDQPSKERDEIVATLKRFDENDAQLGQMRRALTDKLADERFVAGFGSNGGEEFLSYMNIGESLVLKGGDDWTKWDAAMTANLNRVQNADGSWSGHHCITGRTFCTSAALMVLMTDRVKAPVAADIKRR